MRAVHISGTGGRARLLSPLARAQAVAHHTIAEPVIEWQCTMQHMDLMWQKPTIATMNMFTHNTMRSFEHSIVWQFGGADPEFG